MSQSEEYYVVVGAVQCDDWVREKCRARRERGQPGLGGGLASRLTATQEAGMGGRLGLTDLDTGHSPCSVHSPAA